MNKDFFIDIPSIYRQFENKTPFQKIGKVNSSLGSSYEVSLSKAILARLTFPDEYERQFS